MQWEGYLKFSGFSKKSRVFMSQKRAVRTQGWSFILFAVMQPMLQYIHLAKCKTTAINEQRIVRDVLVWWWGVRNSWTVLSTLRCVCRWNSRTPVQKNTTVQHWYFIIVHVFFTCTPEAENWLSYVVSTAYKALSYKGECGDKNAVFNDSCTGGDLSPLTLPPQLYKL